MIRTTGIDFAALESEASDIPFGFGSGGGVIFGVTGGVTEAVIRRLAPDHSKETMDSIAECGVRQEGFIKEFSIPYDGMDVKICVVSGLANARTVMEQVKSGEGISPDRSHGLPPRLRHGRRTAQVGGSQGQGRQGGRHL